MLVSLTPMTSCDRPISQRLSVATTASVPATIPGTAAARAARLYVVLSIRAPTGVVATGSARPASAIAAKSKPRRCR